MTSESRSRQRDSSERRSDRAFRLSVANGAFAEVNQTLIQGGAVLSAFLLKVSNSTVVATMPDALGQLAHVASQLVASNRADARARNMPLYARAGVVRIAAASAMALLALLIGSNGSLIGALVFLCAFFAFASANAVGGVAWTDVILKTVPPTRRGRMMGLRGFFGGLLGVATGFAVRHALGDNGPPFPANYALLYAIAAVSVVGAVVSFSFVDEPLSAAQSDRLSWRKHLAFGAATMRQDARFRRFFASRALGSLSLMAPAVFIPYAIRALGMGEAVVGALLVLSKCAALPSNFIWSRLGDRFGNRLLLLVATAGYLAVPAIAFACQFVPKRQTTLFGFGSVEVRALVFALGYVLSDTTARARAVANLNYLLELAPATRRLSYVSFSGLILAPFALVPVLAGIVASVGSFSLVFALAFGFGFAACVAARRLVEPRGMRDPG